MFKIVERYTLIWSFALGVLLAIFVFKATNDTTTVPKNKSLEQPYEKWFRSQCLTRTVLPMDTVRYGTFNKESMESRYLYRHVKVLCIFLVRKRKNAKAASKTWAQNCNEIMPIYLRPEKRKEVLLPIKRSKLESSWHLLCDGIRKISDSYHWVLFVNDDTFALLENIRYMVAGLDHNVGHYLGHAINFWGTTYNVAQAGYVLSAGSVRALQNRFNSSEACLAGGRFWKQEDFYLGKHLSSLGINVEDTRDPEGLSTFHGYNLGQLLFPGSLPTFANYYKHSTYPVACCSEHSATFQAVEADKMYMYYYLVYGVQVFNGGSLGNRAPPTPRPEQEVWMSFLRDQGITDMNISAERYYELWKNIINDPMHFNQNIRNWSSSVTERSSAP